MNKNNKRINKNSVNNSYGSGNASNRNRTNANGSAYYQGSQSRNTNTNGYVYNNAARNMSGGPRNQNRNPGNRSGANNGKRQNIQSGSNGYGNNTYVNNAYPNQNRKIRQTGSQQQTQMRQAKTKPQKPRLTPQQKEQIRQRELLEKKMRKEKALADAAAAIKLFFKRAAVFLVVYIIFMLTALAAMAINLFTHDRIDKSKYQLQFGNDENEKNNIVCEALNVRDGTELSVYLKMSDFVDQYDFVITGEKDELRYIIKYDDGDGTERYESVLFVNGSADAYVNNVKVKLNSEVIFNGYDDVYVPVDFFEKYLRGITYTVDTNAHKIILCRETDDEAEIVENETAYRELSFTIKSPDVSEPIDENIVEMMTR